MSTRRQEIVVRKHSNRALCGVLTLAGLTPVVVVLLNAWVSGVSLLDLSELHRFLWTNRFYLGFGFGFELFYLVIAGIIAAFSGVSLLARKTPHIERRIVVADDVAVTLKCANCGSRWTEYLPKTQLKLMGFPRNRMISRRRCHECGRFTRPRIVGL